ncbi:hypothetical protein MKK69_18935 [Methylobacterium sp. J-026]|uniref:hypothetical protein n=1 Tax=Methylobacterium sp. J-026 TaxID=2836624 RepID=UPI001FBB6CA8|nr:hypothetical protein [Methylobacterium sp. J-026]MCJ2136098.1 hypothetical protein [Methylobacterium sp. J-026]
MTDAHEIMPRESGPGSPDPAPADPEERERETSNRPLPMTDEDPDVGLSQKGTGEEAVIRRETAI